MKRAVGVVGLGIMGSAMAANLARARFAVYGFDVLKKRIPGVKAMALRDIGHAAPVVITSLPSAEALQDVAKKLEGGCVVVETSTLPIEEKERARKVCELNGVILLDCPLSGTGSQAKTKDLVVYASGDRKSFEKTTAVLKGFSRAHYYLGEFGNGSRMKFVANLLVAIHNVSAAEAFALGMKAGLPAKTIFDVQAGSAGASRMLQVRGPMMVAGRYDEVTMKNEVWQKDMKIIGEFAAKLGVPTPLFNASAAVYSAAMAQGYAKQDTGAVCAVMEAMAGIRRKRRG